MAGKGMKGLGEVMRGLSLATQPCRAAVQAQQAPPACRRTMATEAPLPNITRSITEPWAPTSTVPLTIYSFPKLEPRALESWSAKHLYLPLRRDILHLAVIYEGDKTRQGTASSKTRWEVAGSHRKIRPQKGGGNSRLGTKQSPMLRGGGKAHGPRPRDFSTKLNRKVYDLAWRTALSYRYRRGELIVTEDGLDLPLPDEFLDLAQRGSLGQKLEDSFIQKYVRDMMSALQWGKHYGRTTFVTGDKRANLFTALDVAKSHGRALELEDVDVKDLLETGRIVIERSALKEMVKRHESDLLSNIAINGRKKTGPMSGLILVKN